MKQIMRAIGLMSGTSMDGIDAALIETDGETYVKPLKSTSLAYNADFKKQIEDALADAQSMKDRRERPGSLADLERAITAWHIYAIAQLGEVADIIGFHGQTVLHRPDKAFTVQLGDGLALARETGMDVVFDMRANDMAHGGQGAPLVPVYHQALAAQLDEETRKGGTGFINIGGIANASFIFENCNPVALDCGPGNALIDQWVQKEAGIPFDEDGHIASQGTADDAVIAQYLALPFFARQGPKSLDRSDFTLDPVQGMGLSDGAATLAKLTAVAIAKTVLDLLQVPRTLIVSGGGARNTAIMRFLEDALDYSHFLRKQGNDLGLSFVATSGKPLHTFPGAVPGTDIKVETSDSYGFSPDMMEAEAWAYLAVRSLKGLALTFPSTTGCKEPVTGGVLAKAFLQHVKSPG